MAAATRERVISSLLDTLFPSLDVDLGDGDSRLQAYYNLRGSDLEGLSLKVLQLIESRLDDDKRSQIHMLLWLLSTRWGTLVLMGRESLNPVLPAAFPNMPRSSREKGLLNWSASSQVTFRKAFVGIKGLLLSALGTWLDPQSQSPVLSVLGYAVTDTHRPPAPAPQARDAEAVILSRLVDLSAADGSPAGVARAAASLAAKGCKILWPGARQRGSSAVPNSVWKESPAFVVPCDAIVVGSGAGGGVTAARLAAGGLQVVVLEKATLVRADQMSLKEGESMEAMYEAAGLLTTETGALSILAGSTLGGGTRVNWCASFRTPDHVRREWAQEYGLEAFAGDEYTVALDAVCARLGVRTGFEHGSMCSTLGAGLQAAGMDCGEVPRNCQDPACGGHCCFGCARGAKQDTVNTFLADACANGARVITSAYAEKILTHKRTEAAEDESETSGPERKRQAVGVVVTAGQAGGAPLRLVFTAPIVVSSAGSLHTPALLLRSGITCNGNVGANLRLHPCAVVVGKFDPGAAIPTFSPGPGANIAHPTSPIRCWEGPIMSVFSREVGNWDTSGYGALLYTPAAHPGLFAAALPWQGGRAYKDLMLDFPKAAAVLVLCRDSGSGRVKIDRTGRSRVDYVIAPADREAMVRGMQAGLTAMAAAGAKAVMTLHASAEGLHAIDPGLGRQDPGFQKYLEWVAAQGVADLKMPTFSAHQMGTARLGIDPQSSVLDPNGECWEVAGLYCADGSTFPTPTGVNPMITIEAIAYMLAGRIAERQSVGRRRRAHTIMYESHMADPKL